MKTMRNHLVVAVALLLVTGFGAGCKRAATSFPPTGTVAGWEKTGPTRSFNADTLSQYIDGAADQYVSAGIGTAYTADYKYQGTVQAVVDVYHMSSSASAQRIF